MKRLTTATAIIAMSSAGALAGGIDRTGQFLGPLFEKGGETGQYTEFSFRIADPQASAAAIPADPLAGFSNVGFAYKTDITDQLSFALILDQPFGADVDYRPVIQGFAFIDATAVTGVARYKFNDTWSVHGGLRLQEIGGSIQTTVGGVPFNLTASSDYAVGALAGVAYERPDIALRVALTYNSEIDQSLTGTEINLAGPTVSQTNFTVTTPASWNLEFQTGIAQNTLLFGSVRYVEWEGFNLSTPAAGQYVNFTDDTTTYSLGIGRRFNENWSGAIVVGYEEGDDTTNTLLAPTDGFTTLGLGAT
ncbi:MAG: hypothetical protein OXC60_07050 [Litoreibacter sp.]|nr:hypothetical protein [Litoreibacter sp.]